MNRRAFLALAAVSPLLAPERRAVVQTPWIKLDGTFTRVHQVELAAGVFLQVFDLDDLRLNAGDYTVVATDDVRPYTWSSDRYMPSGSIVLGKGVVFVSPKDVWRACDAKADAA